MGSKVINDVINWKDGGHVFLFGKPRTRGEKGGSQAQERGQGEVTWFWAGNRWMLIGRNGGLRQKENIFFNQLIFLITTNYFSLHFTTLCFQNNPSLAFPVRKSKLHIPQHISPGPIEQLQFSQLQLLYGSVFISKSSPETVHGSLISLR